MQFTPAEVSGNLMLEKERAAQKLQLAAVRLTLRVRLGETAGIREPVTLEQIDATTTLDDGQVNPDHCVPLTPEQIAAKMGGIIVDE